MTISSSQGNITVKIPVVANDGMDKMMRKACKTAGISLIEIQSHRARGKGMSAINTRTYRLDCGPKPAALAEIVRWLMAWVVHVDLPKSYDGVDPRTEVRWEGPKRATGGSTR